MLKQIMKIRPRINLWVESQRYNPPPKFEEAKELEGLTIDLAEDLAQGRKTK